MKFILDATNLLGDSFYLLSPVAAFCEQNPEDVECVVCSPGLVFEMFMRVLPDDTVLVASIKQATTMFSEATVLNLGAGQAATLSYTAHKIDPQKEQPHISEAYARLLGLVTQPGPPDKLRTGLNLEKTHFAISPFSRSCSRHTGESPNKTLDDWKWEHIIRYLRRQDLPVKVIAGPEDKLVNTSIPVNDYFVAHSFFELETFLSSTALLISLDNGIGHIASFLGTPMISLWPRVSNMSFIAPRWGAKNAFIQMDPNNVSPAQLLAGIKKFTRALISH
ncbi:MAG: glycosyltransferase family 9 protein [Janthinobacterium lividum]